MFDRLLVNLLKASFCRAVTMYQYTRKWSQEDTNFKQQLQNYSKGQESSSTKTVPIRAIVSAETASMGNTVLKSNSKKLETTGSSQGQRSRTRERTSPTTNRTLSLQREQSLVPYVHHNNSSTPQKFDYAESRNPRNRDCGKTVVGSSFSTHEFSGVSAGCSFSPLSFGSNSTTDSRECVVQSHRYLPGPPDLRSFTTPPSDSLDIKGRSNDRQSRATERSGASRLRSASQGLRNLGNTCYMNSVLQCLAKVPWFKKGSPPPSVFRDDLLNEFFILMKKMQENGSETPLNPTQFRNQISALGFRFSSSEQNDAHEFLLCLLSRLSKTMKSEKKRNLVEEFLLGKQQNVIRFEECGHVLSNEQPFFSISLSINLENGKSWRRYTTVDLLKCLEIYTKKEDVDGDALCMDCGITQHCSIEASFKLLPKFLIIHLKRFDFLRAEKLENEVSFPLKGLRIIQKDLDQRGIATGRERDVFYDLIAVCNHYGSLRFGHYTADIKSTSNNWYNYSDSRVTRNHTMCTSYSSLTSREASILFYERTDPI